MKTFERDDDDEPEAWQAAGDPRPRSHGPAGYTRGPTTGRPSVEGQPLDSGGVRFFGPPGPRIVPKTRESIRANRDVLMKVFGVPDDFVEEFLEVTSKRIPPHARST